MSIQIGAMGIADSDRTRYMLSMYGHMWRGVGDFVFTTSDAERDLFLRRRWDNFEALDPAALATIQFDGIEFTCSYGTRPLEKFMWREYSDEFTSLDSIKASDSITLFLPIDKILNRDDEYIRYCNQFKEFLANNSSSMRKSVPVVFAITRLFDGDGCKERFSRAVEFLQNDFAEFFVTGRKWYVMITGLCVQENGTCFFNCHVPVLFAIKYNIFAPASITAIETDMKELADRLDVLEVKLRHENVHPWRFFRRRIRTDINCQMSNIRHELHAKEVELSRLKKYIKAIDHEIDAGGFSIVYEDGKRRTRVTDEEE